jgi:hypothetical protein
MEAFIEGLRDANLQELLAVAIRGPGAFRRFKNVLADHLGERERWFAFRRARTHQRIREWLESEGIEPVPRPPERAGGR